MNNAILSNMDLMMNIEFVANRSLQTQLREKLVYFIRQGQFGENALPSSRRMAQALKISRNTVVAVYDGLMDEGYLISRDRRGIFVNPQVLDDNWHGLAADSRESSELALPVNWQGRLKIQPSSYRTLEKDPHWMDYPYPFIYGQVQPEEFPLYQWRDCSRQAQGKGHVKDWVEDYLDADNKELVMHIRQQVLNKRGIVASDDQVLITLGTQNSLSLLANLLADNTTTVGVEEPGYLDARHIFQQAKASISPLALDQDGVKTGKQLNDCDYVFVTPSHQFPTTVTMSLQRRKTLLQQAKADDFIIIEDDYESEVNFLTKPLPALKSLDNSGRVIYVGSFSKALSPGLRIGYLVADAQLIKQLRALRRLSYRHAPANNQQTLALFMGQGFYESHVRRMRGLYEEKWQLMQRGLEQYLPNCELHSTPGSFCFWLELPTGLTCQTLIKRAAEKGIFVEAGDALFMHPPKDKYFIRLGFSAIPKENILEGLKALGKVIKAI